MSGAANGGTKESGEDHGGSAETFREEERQRGRGHHIRRGSIINVHSGVVQAPATRMPMRLPRPFSATTPLHLQLQSEAHTLLSQFSTSAGSSYTLSILDCHTTKIYFTHPKLCLELLEPTSEDHHLVRDGRALQLLSRLLVYPCCLRTPFSASPK